MVRLAGQIDHARALAAAGEADVGHQRFAGTVHDAADDRKAHRGGDMGQALLQRFDGLNDVEALPRAGRAGDDVDAAGAQAERLQDVEADLDLLDRIGGEAHADGVADPGPEQRAHADRGLHGAGAQGPRLGDADVQRAVDGLGQLLVGCDGHEGVGRLHADLELVEVVVLQDAGVIEGAFDHRVGAGLAVLLQQLLFQRAGVDADAHGAAVVAGGLDDLLDPVDRADVAGVDAQAGGARLGRLDAAVVVEMDVGHERHAGLARDGAEGRRRLDVRAGDADDVGPGLFQLADLVQRRRRIGGRGVGHRLDADRGVAADRNGADHDLAALAALDVAPGADVAEFGTVVAHDAVHIGQEGRQNHDRGRKIVVVVKGSVQAAGGWAAG
uniref:LigA n=1 Tax=Parastrongyloides trichosuri TaxID=131310 RepID=A0A0N4ZLI6_PARTI